MFLIFPSTSGFLIEIASLQKGSFFIINPIKKKTAKNVNIVRPYEKVHCPPPVLRVIYVYAKMSKSREMMMYRVQGKYRPHAV